jgi:diguanylate cyclase (GGDEF)-like protein
VSVAGFERPEHFDTGPLAFAAAENERLLSQLRVLIVALLTIIPVAKVMTNGFGDPVYSLTVVFNVGALVVALAIMVLLQRTPAPRPWLGRVTAVFDVCLITALLAMYAVSVGHEAGMLNRHTFPIYLVALAGAGLRLDRGAVTLAGIAALLGWSGVIWLSLQQPSAAALAPEQVRSLLIEQTNRFMILGIGTVVAFAYVRVGTRLVELAALDGLTGTLNRSAFEPLLRRELQRALRHGRRFAIGYLDIDELKQINDRFGHGRGDDAIRAVAQRLVGALRKSDVIARQAGDEFVVLMPEAGALDAVKRLDAIRALLAAHPLASGGQELTLRITAGVACFPDDATEALTLLDIADSRLLAGKRAGRDRVVGP